MSAHHEFRTCQRKYFFSRVAANHRSHVPLRQAAYARKRLQSLPAWRGSLLHQALDECAVPIAREERGAIERSQELVGQRAAAQFEFSRLGTYRTSIKNHAPATYAALLPHEDDEPVDDEPRASIEAVTQALKNLAEFDELKRYLRFASVHTERLLRTQEGNVQVIGKADAIAFGNRVVLIDWKLNPTGSVKALRQLEVYGWILAHRETRPILLVEANLARSEIEEWELNDQRQDTAENFVHQSIDQIDALFGDNRFDAGILADLDYAKSQRACALCPYRKICWEAK